MEASVYCGANFYDDQCSTFCVARDNCDGHFECDPSTGAQVCLPGWAGADCTERQDPTDPQYCSVTLPVNQCKSNDVPFSLCLF